MIFGKSLIAGTTLLALMLSISMYNIFVDSNNTAPNPSKGIPGSVHTLFSKWKAAYGIIYNNPQENNMRLQIFFDTLKSLPRYRRKNPKGVYKLNDLSDISTTEFMNAMTKTSKNRRNETENLKLGTPRNNPKNNPELRKSLRKSHNSLSRSDSFEMDFPIEHVVIKSGKKEDNKKRNSLSRSDSFERDFPIEHFDKRKGEKEEEEENN